MASKLKIKLGSIEVDYEGEEQFLKEELPALLKAISDLYATLDHEEDERSDGGKDLKRARHKSGTKIDLSTRSIAAKLGGTSGRDLILAASAYLALAAGKDTFSRKEILDAAKSATGYYKQSISKNLSDYLETLLKEEKLTEGSSGVYALHANAKTELETKLAK
jgi:hypothetical protein